MQGLWNPTSHTIRHHIPFNAKFDAEFLVKIFIPPTHLGENRFFVNLRRLAVESRTQNFYTCLWNSIKDSSQVIYSKGTRTRLSTLIILIEILWWALWIQCAEISNSIVPMPVMDTPQLYITIQVNYIFSWFRSRAYRSVFNRNCCV